MSKLKDFFSASARNLNMQQLTPSEIATRMERTNENSLRLPRSFARAVSQILEAQEDMANKANAADAKKRRRANLNCLNKE